MHSRPFSTVSENAVTTAAPAERVNSAPDSRTGTIAVGATSPGRVLILGGDSDRNVGDQAILHALCACLHRADNRVAVTVIGDCPRLRGLPGVTRVIPRGPRGVAPLLDTAHRQDLIIVGGGGLFQDDDSRIKMPYWGTRLRLLSRINPRLVGHSLGAGPLTHVESRWFARLACDSLKSVTVRDSYARACLGNCIQRHPGIVPDPAFMLPPATPGRADQFLRRLGFQPDTPLIGVALRGWFQRRGGFLPRQLRPGVLARPDLNSPAMNRYVRQVALALSALAEELGASVLLMPSYFSSREGDTEVCRRVINLMPRTVARLACIHDAPLYKAVCGRLRIMISARMHPLILAAGMAVPGVGLGYNGKFAGYFATLGSPERLMPLDALGRPGQVDRLLSLARHALDDQADLARLAAALALRSRRATEQLLAETRTASGGAS